MKNNTKKIIPIYFLLLSVCFQHTAQAMEEFSDLKIEVNFTDNGMKYQKYVSISCNSESTFCAELCGDQLSCDINEKYCRNCASNSLTMHLIFNQMDSFFRVSYQDNSATEGLRELLKTGDFVTLHPKNIFNQFERYSDPAREEKYLNLCKMNENEKKTQKIVFFSTTKFRRTNLAKYAYCNGEVFNIELNITTQIRQLP